MTIRSEDDEVIELYSGPLSMFGAKAEIAVLEKGIECRRTFVPFSLAKLYEPKHPVVARVNPKGQVPVLVDGDLEIFDSTQIFEDVEDIQPTPALWPADPRRSDGGLPTSERGAGRGRRPLSGRDQPPLDSRSEMNRFASAIERLSSATS